MADAKENTVLTVEALLDEAKGYLKHDTLKGQPKETIDERTALVESYLKPALTEAYTQEGKKHGVSAEFVTSLADKINVALDIAGDKWDGNLPGSKGDSKPLAEVIESEIANNASKKTNESASKANTNAIALEDKIIEDIWKVYQEKLAKSRGARGTTPDDDLKIMEKYQKAFDAYTANMKDLVASYDVNSVPEAQNIADRLVSVIEARVELIEREKAHQKDDTLPEVTAKEKTNQTNKEKAIATLYTDLAEDYANDPKNAKDKTKEALDYTVSRIIDATLKANPEADTNLSAVENNLGALKDIVKTPHAAKYSGVSDEVSNGQAKEEGRRRGGDNAVEEGWKKHLKRGGTAAAGATLIAMGMNSGEQQTNEQGQPTGKKKMGFKEAAIIALGVTLAASALLNKNVPAEALKAVSGNRRG